MTKSYILHVPNVIIKINGNIKWIFETNKIVSKLNYFLINYLQKYLN